MARLPNATVGDAYTSVYAYELLEDLVDVGNRMAGQKGEAAGATRVAESYDEIGLRNVSINEFDIPGWWRGESSLAVDGRSSRTCEADHEVIALPGSPSGTVTAGLVDVGHGRPQDFDTAEIDGNIVIASSATPDDYGRWIHRMEKYCYAVDNGAVGFVFQNHIDGCLPPTGEIGYHNRPGPIPAVGVSKEVGAALGRYATDNPTVTVDVECRNEASTSRNISGELGPDTDEVVLLTAHIDAHDIAPGANDNGAGTVLVAETARLLKQIEDALETRVRCVVFGSEEIGLRGAYDLADRVDLETVKAVLNVDGAGRDRTLSVRTNEFEPLNDLFQTVTNELEVPVSADPTVSPHGDQWAFTQEGIPSVMISSTNPTKSGRGWGHTHADTIDKIDIRDLRAHAVAVGNAVCAAVEPDREIPARTPEDTQSLIDPGYQQELKIGGRWPYE